MVAESALLMVDDGNQSIRYQVSDAMWEMVRRHRRLSAGSECGPWWRLLLRIDADSVEVVADQGAQEPFPGEQLFAPDAYLADVERYPRSRLAACAVFYLADDGVVERFTSSVPLSVRHRFRATVPDA
ncbi:hypothetical protein ACIG56_00025 [Nocardia fusca]|uniref:hypothetical protein n=1 Tax=Nocardia fusca TaxID=941183 RepID=UPI0037C51194